MNIHCYNVHETWKKSKSEKTKKKRSRKWQAVLTGNGYTVPHHCAIFYTMARTAARRYIRVYVYIYESVFRLKTNKFPRAIFRSSFAPTHPSAHVVAAKTLLLLLLLMYCRHCATIFGRIRFRNQFTTYSYPAVTAVCQKVVLYTYVTRKVENLYAL